MDSPGDFRSWESPQTLPALFIGPFEGVERFRNLKFAVIRITDIQKTVLSFFEGTTAIHFAFKQRLINNKPSYYYSNGPAKIYTEVDCDWWRRTFGDCQESPGCLRSPALSQVYLSLTFQLSQTAVVKVEMSSTFPTVLVKLSNSQL